MSALSVVALSVCVTACVRDCPLACVRMRMFDSSCLYVFVCPCFVCAVAVCYFALLVLYVCVGCMVGYLCVCSSVSVACVFVRVCVCVCVCLSRRWFGVSSALVCVVACCAALRTCVGFGCSF